MGVNAIHVRCSVSHQPNAALDPCGRSKMSTVSGLDCIGQVCPGGMYAKDAREVEIERLTAALDVARKHARAIRSEAGFAATWPFPWENNDV